jgi:CelD/BcsL family acetyltransferase involved in cellulose biosynthesis
MQGDELRIVRTAGELDALAGDWNDLAQRSPGYYFSQTYRWAAAAWRHIADPRGRTLQCLTLRAAGRLVAVWPLVVERRGVLAIVRPLGPEASEYCAPLVEPGGDHLERTKRLWREAARLADLVVLPNVRSGTPLSDLLASAGLWRAPDKASPAPFVPRKDYADWAAYQASLSGSMRRRMRRARAKLPKDSVFALEPPENGVGLIDWMLAGKQRWLSGRGLDSNWIGRTDYHDFLAALAVQPHDPDGALLFTLKIDGKLVASKLATIDPGRLEIQMDVYDPAWSAAAPGRLLTEHCLQWALERGLDFDFRLGEEDYKLDWAPLSCAVVSWYIATGWRGLPVVARRRAVLWSWQLKALMRRLLRRGRGT